LLPDHDDAMMRPPPPALKIARQLPARLPAMPDLPTRTLPAIAAGLVLLATGAQPASAADLEVVVTNIRVPTGFVRLGLYNNPALFPKRRGTIDGGDVKVKGNTATYVFHNLKPGAYAVAIYHDANANKHFDKTLGIPMEGFGFSNNARPRLSAPSFKRAAITLKAPRTRITIRLLHW
jgi:uncharacterized protein (DUF2141 family)